MPAAIEFGLHRCHRISEAVGENFGYGFVFPDGRDDTGLIESAETYGWVCYFSSFYRIDPEEDMVMVLLTQTYPYNNHIFRTFINTTYQAISN